jgi:hypothetical protein
MFIRDLLFARINIRGGLEDLFEEVCACLCALFCVGFLCARRGGRGQGVWLSMEVSCGNSAAARERLRERMILMRVRGKPT